MTVLGVADRDPGLFATWVEELEAKAETETKRDQRDAEVALAATQLLSLLRIEFLASKGVKNLPEVWVPVDLRRPKPKFSPLAFAQAHMSGGEG